MVLSGHLVNTSFTVYSATANQLESCIEVSSPRICCQHLAEASRSQISDWMDVSENNCSLIDTFQLKASEMFEKETGSVGLKVFCPAVWSNQPSRWGRTSPGGALPPDLDVRVRRGRAGHGVRGVLPSWLLVRRVAPLTTTRSREC